MHFTKLCDAFYRLRKLCQMLLLCSCAFFFILNPKAFFSESFPFPMLFSSNFIIFMPVLHSSQRFRKSEILGLRFCVKSCGLESIGPVSQHMGAAHILCWYQLKRYFPFFCAPWGWLHMYKLKSKNVKNSRNSWKPQDWNKWKLV